MLNNQIAKYLATLKIGSSSCRGFEEDALGACIGLVNYTTWPDAKRLVWLTSVQAATANPAGGLTASAQNQTFFYHALLNRKRSALGPAIKPHVLRDIDAISYPWALPESLFRALDATVQQGTGLAGAKAISWTEIVDRVASFEKVHGAETPIAAGAWLIAQRFVTKFAPRLGAIMAAPELGVAIGVAGELGLEFINWTTRLSNAEAKANFAIDRQRRDGDALLSRVAALQK